MKMIHYLVMGILVSAGLGLGSVLVPRDRELGLIFLKDKQFEAARRTLEEQFAGGDSSVSVVIPLGELYLQFGDTDAAVALMEEFVRENPGSLEAMEHVGTLYQYAQRSDDYLRNLEAINAMRPRAATLRELSGIYYFRAEYDQQIEVLTQLTESFPADPLAFLDLAKLQAVQARYADAVATLRKLETLHPGSMDDDTAQFLVGLMLDAGDGEGALAYVTERLQENPDPDVAAASAALFRYKNRPREALTLLAPFEALSDDHPGLLAQLVQLRITLGEPEWAFSKLEALHVSGKLSQVLEEPFMDLLLTRGEATRAFEAAESFDLTVMPGWLLSNLAEAAVANDMPGYADRMIERLGEGFLESRPILGAELALARNDTAGAAEWVDKAENSDLVVSQQVALGGLYARMERTGDAIRVLSRLAMSGDLPDVALGDLTLFYMESNRQAEGLEIVEALRRERSSVEIEMAWALLATSRERSEEVTSWFETNRSGGLAIQALSDIVFIASDTAQHGVALSAADRLYRVQPTPENRFLLASVQVSAGRPAEALPHLRALSPGSLEVQNTYVAALSAARVLGKPVEDELHRVLSLKLSEPGLDDEQTEEIVYGLLDLGAYDTVLPALKDLARRKGGAWFSAYVDAAVKTNQVDALVEYVGRELEEERHPDLAEDQLYALLEHGGQAPALPHLRRFSVEHGGSWDLAYEDALQQLNRSGELLEFWTRRAHEPGTSGAEKRDLAFRMLDARHKTSAENLFRDLAVKELPDGENVSQLLFLWGPRPGESELAWLEERARSSTDDERAGWMRHLINSGAPHLAAEVAAIEMPPAGNGGQVLDVYLEALIVTAGRDALAEAIRRELPFVNESEGLRRLGRRVIEAGHAPSGRDVYAKLLQLNPDDAEALRQFGLTDFLAGDYVSAASHLSRYVTLTGGDPETNFYWGELLRRKNLTEEARSQYQRAIAQIDSQTPELQIQVIRGLLLHRLDRIGESMAQFEGLLKERPGDKHLRADYAGVLLEAGLYEDAERILQR